MDRLIFVNSFEPLNSKFCIISWPALENQTTLFPPSLAWKLKKITLIHEGKVTAVVHTSRDRRSDLQERSYTDFIWEFSQKGLQELIWLLNPIDSVPLFLKKLICRTAFSPDLSLQSWMRKLRRSHSWLIAMLLCAIPSHGSSEKKKSLITTELYSLLLMYTIHQENRFSSVQGQYKLSKHNQSLQYHALFSYGWSLGFQAASQM